MGSAEFRIGINETEYVGNLKIITETTEEKKKKVIPGSVAQHEAKHAVAAVINGTGVKKATIIPGPGYLGLTELNRPDAIAAAAPHATGCRGTSHDVAIVQLMGHDIHAAANTARRIISNNQEKVEAVASVLEERGTVSGFEIEEAMKSTSEKAKKVTIIIEDLVNGKKETEQATTSDGIVVFRSDWLAKKDKFSYKDTNENKKLQVAA